MSAIVRVNDVSFCYHEGVRNALSHISLEIEEGDFLGIIGSGGAGKSTLTYMLNGVVPHHFKGDFYGSVTVNGLDTVESNPEALAQYVGSVFQDIDSQMVATMVEDEILFGLENFGVPHPEIETRIADALMAAGITDLHHRAISSLSGGQKQKVAIAAILALLPKIIVLDEPTGELDPQASRKVFETLRYLNKQYGTTIIVVEQKIMLLCEFAKRLAVMEQGGLVLTGGVEEVLQHADTLEAVGVNVPRVTTLARKLREEGIYRGKLPLNLAQGTEMMREVLPDAVL